MIRQIKFRAWFPSECFQDGNGRMFYNQCISANGKVMHLEGNWDYTGDEEKAIPMQFTGLLDKNGKEIYEGDITKWHFNYHPISESYGQRTETRTLVEFKDGRFTVGSNDCEVIGNIHEHPHLFGR